MRKRWMMVIAVLVVGINSLLLFFDTEGKVDRISYVNEWVHAEEADMAEKLYKFGVLDAVEDNHVYYNESLGEFQEFLIDEGEEVSAGDPLFTYNVADFYETFNTLNSDSQRLDGEIDAIEDAITEMERYRVPDSGGVSNSTFSLDEEGLEIDLAESTTEAEFMREQYLIEKEKELAQKEAQLSSVESQLSELENTGDTITVESSYDGIVKNVSYDLGAPLVTIESSELEVVGELTEEERTRVEEGMDVEMTLGEQDVLVEGTIVFLSKTPKENSIDEERVYPFAISVDGEELGENEMLAGYHSNMTITLLDSPETVVLHEDVVFMNRVWKMNEEGLMIQKPIDRGIKMQELVEIAEGIEVGDIIAKSPEDEFRDEAPFITKLQSDDLTRDAIKDERSNWKEFLVTGLISR
ncbi:HlyD family secretion protein [Halalkalibacillus sediminis]|uniref:HlyD family secretion protein n=1 Tax=Halalkalibacillus sediminis TaxID=2018042 RepID=A0A2I0QUS3_9BACI|nr:efflux RND transporter periplasmic adaptor subunit [Halalkalibacillus sediminis]PKR77840.1 HlyD family secretion protein [Halalkalibacillus sediminis]